MGNEVAVARVKLTLDVSVNGSWGEDCTLGQIIDQAGSGAINNIRVALSKHDVNIVGIPEVTMITHIKPKVR